MDRNKILTSISNTGELLVVLGASLWITRLAFTEYIFALGSVLFSVCRLMERHGDSGNTALKRLYVQRTLGGLMLVLSASLMIFHSQINGFAVSDYMVRVTPAAWLVPFMIFAVIEIYTAFRIPAEQKKDLQ